MVFCSERHVPHLQSLEKLVSGSLKLETADVWVPWEEGIDLKRLPGIDRALEARGKEYGSATV